MLFKFDDEIFQRVLQQHLTESQRSFLGKQGFKRADDFLLMQPKRYDRRRYDMTIQDLKQDQPVSIIGRLRQVNRRKIRKNLTVVNAMLNTKSDQIPVVWFNQVYVLDRLKNDPFVVLHGVLESSSMSVVFKVSDIELCGSFKETMDGKICPLYPDIRGLSDKKIRTIVTVCLTKCMHAFKDFVPQSILDKERIPSCMDALKMFHFPEDQAQLMQALNRFKFDEMFGYLFPRRYRHFETKVVQRAVELSLDHNYIDGYFQQLPYSLTGAQQRVWDHIYSDIEQQKCVYRLIQGDVGSGKTDIAILSLLAAVGSGYKGAILVPTEILAQQHYYKCLSRCANMDVPILLLKGKLSKQKKAAIHERLDSDEALIIVGTHALIQDDVVIKDLAMVVIDEQHRFGVFQRQALLKKSAHVPHCLFMTATPIPRTLMLTHYGDLDHDVIDELPPGRRAPKTYYAKSNRMIQIYEFIRLEVQAGRQAYVVFPLIEESEHLDLECAMAGFERMSEYFSNQTVGLLHGRMSDDDKVSIMDQFKDNQVQILVSTTVIEVGVDVPNASVMIIMNAERFGLSQLHQLRGRVGRGADQSHCFLVADAKSPESKQRIKAMLDTTNGFQLAEIDLKIRGPGNLLGAQQSGDLAFSFANAMDQAYIQHLVSICDEVIHHQDQYPELMAYFEMSPMMMAKQLN